MIEQILVVQIAVENDWQPQTIGFVCQTKIFRSQNRFCAGCAAEVPDIVETRFVAEFRL